MKLNKQILVIFKKYKLLIFLLIVVLFYRLIFNPLLNHWREMNQRISLLERKFAKITRLLGEEKEINSFYKELSSVINIKPIEKKFSEQEEQTLAFRFLNQSVKKTGGIIKSITPYKLKTQKEYKVLRIDLSLEADLPSLVKFVYYVENSPQLMRVKEARVRASKGGVLLATLKLEKIIF